MDNNFLNLEALTPVCLDNFILFIGVPGFSARQHKALTAVDNLVDADIAFLYVIVSVTIYQIKNRMQ
jgi:hypothetical protein